MTIEEKISALTERIEDLAASGYYDWRTEENLIKTAIVQFAREVLEMAAQEASDYADRSHISDIQRLGLRAACEQIRTLLPEPKA